MLVDASPVLPLVLTVLSLLSALLLAVAFVLTGYLGILAALARRRPPPKPPAPTTHFSFVVPAHNEEQGIAATVASLLAVDWPQDRFAVFVVADNCTDATAASARAAGAVVLVRENADLRGKGYALEHGFAHVLQNTETDAVVVVDADTIVDRNLLSAFAARIHAGALALQAEYGVRNVDASWRTELMALALAMFHTLRSLARERLGVSVGLRGNGMCFTRACLLRFPHRAYGLVEDAEYGVALGQGGVRVFGVDDAHVWGEMVSSSRASESQRRRWEEGRALLRRSKTMPLLRQGLRNKDGICLDLAFDLLVPPLSTVFAITALGVLVDVVRLVLGGGLLLGGLWLVPITCLGLYLVRGIQLSGLGWRAPLVLGRAPLYLVWKLWLKLKGGQEKAWVRTARESQSSDGPQRNDSA